MKKSREWGLAAAVLASALLTPGVAFAGQVVGRLPAPGVLGLVAIGVVAAIGISRLRK